jgi:hypothetical protein
LRKKVAGEEHVGIEEGIIAGLWGGVIMALLSETGFRLGMSNSSLMLVDGLFAFRTMRKQPQPRVVYLLGTVIHLFTSAVFGIAYVLGCRILGVDPVSFSTLSVYAFLLWLAMLFVALPVSGQGLFGRRMGPYTPLVQLVIHAGFLAGFWRALN